jgi:hypothetical protein
MLPHAPLSAQYRSLIRKVQGTVDAIKMDADKFNVPIWEQNFMDT